MTHVYVVFVRERLADGWTLANPLMVMSDKMLATGFAIGHVMKNFAPHVIPGKHWFVTDCTDDRHPQIRVHDAPPPPDFDQSRFGMPNTCDAGELEALEFGRTPRLLVDVIQTECVL